MFRLLASILLFTFFTILLGAWVRLEGAGLSCPDWPLCHGKIIPPMEYRIMLEYFHRLAAFFTSIFLLIATIFTFIKSNLRKQFKFYALIAVVLLISQVVLGMLTVTKLLQWEVVTFHLAFGILFFCVVFLWTLAAYRREYPLKRMKNLQKNRFLELTGLGAVMSYIQILLGGSVSSNHAGLACPDFPSCHGQWFPGFSGSIGVQFTHRLGAFILTIFLLFLSWKWFQFFKNKGSLQWIFPSIVLLCLAFQWSLGVGMIFLGVSSDMTIPAPLSVAHLAFATILLLSILGMYSNLRHATKIST